MILAEIKREGVRRNRRHCKARSIWPIVAPNWGLMQEGDSNFSDLKNMVKKPTRNTLVMAPWISEANWMLVDQRMALIWTHTEGQQELRTMTRHFQTALKEDRRCRLIKAG